MDTSISLPTFWELTAPTENSQTELLRALYNYSSPPEVVTNSTAIWASQSVISTPLQKYNKKNHNIDPLHPNRATTHTQLPQRQRELEMLSFSAQQCGHWAAVAAPAGLPMALPALQPGEAPTATTFPAGDAQSR